MSVITTGKRTDREVLTTVARKLIDAHGITFESLTTTFNGDVIPANHGWNGGTEQAVLVAVKEMSAELLARIIFAEPDADLYSVHCGTWLGKYESGPSLVHRIAATAIMARIRDLLGVCSGTTNRYAFEQEADLHALA